MDQNSTPSESRRAAVGRLSRIFPETVCAEGRGLLESARLLGSAEGSGVSAASVMSALHKTGELCACEDEEATRSLYQDGAPSAAEGSSREVCTEADGAWIRLQRAPEGAPRKAEIKALVGIG